MNSGAFIESDALRSVILRPCLAFKNERLFFSDSNSLSLTVDGSFSERTRAEKTKRKNPRQNRKNVSFHRAGVERTGSQRDEALSTLPAALACPSLYLSKHVTKEMWSPRLPFLPFSEEEADPPASACSTGGGRAQGSRWTVCLAGRHPV